MPATTEGIAALEQLLGEGMNINVMLMFGYDVYRRVAHAYLAALKAFAAYGGELKTLASVR